MRSAENVARRRAQAERMESSMSALRGEQATHHYGKTLPLVVLDFQLLRACFRDRVELRAAVVLGYAFFRLDPAAVLEAHERDVDRALVQNDLIAADLLDTAGDAVSVERAHGEQRAEDHEVQCALEDLEFVGRHTPVLWDVHRSVWPFMWYVNRRRPCPGGGSPFVARPGREGGKAVCSSLSYEHGHPVVRRAPLWDLWCCVTLAYASSEGEARRDGSAAAFGSLLH